MKKILYLVFDGVFSETILSELSKFKYNFRLKWVGTDR